MTSGTAPSARDRLLGFVHDKKVPNLVGPTGDVHEDWAGELKLDFADPASKTVGHEFVATSIASGGYLLCEVTPDL